MKNRRLLLLALCLGLKINAPAAEQQLTLNPHLELLRPLLGKTWKGVFNQSKPEKPTVDIARWERALNGQAVRLLHSINEGVYGGETLIVWNDKAQKIEFYYFTTANYMTTGTMELRNGKIETHETIKGDAGAISEVRATTEILAGNKFRVRAEYLKNGEWALGHEVTYEEDPRSQVIFK